MSLGYSVMSILSSDWDWEWGWEMELVPPVPGDDSIISWATHKER